MPDDTLTPSDVALLRLKRAGWSVGETAFAGQGGTTCLVSGSNGENVIRAWGPTQGKAWAEAVRQARELGMDQHWPGRSSLEN